ncbi:MAG: hypothetical protein ABSG66_10405, partial [Stellaceae bacterium]
PGRYDPLHRLRGWSALGLAVSQLLQQHQGALLLSDEREDLAVLTYYVRPIPSTRSNGTAKAARSTTSSISKPIPRATSARISCW